VLATMGALTNCSNNVASLMLRATSLGFPKPSTMLHFYNLSHLFILVVFELLLIVLIFVTLSHNKNLCWWRKHKKKRRCDLLVVVME
jgi:hypothetical protein